MYSARTLTFAASFAVVCGICAGDFVIMSDYKILSCIRAGARGHISFHTPGHKGGGEIAKFFPAWLDVTELSYTDELGSPSGVIAEAQADIAQICGANRAYILTDGSTCGVFAMVCALSKRGGKIIVPRNSHKSVWNACRMFGAEPVVVQGEERNGVLRLPTPNQIEAAICRNEGVAGMIAVSPDYYGNVAPLAEYAQLLHARGLTLAVDGAHGAHFAFKGGSAFYAGTYADIWVDGAHKSLPALTQGAALLIKDLSLAEGAEEGLSLLCTTSPSYPIMASVEFAYKYLAAHKKKLDNAQSLAARFKARHREYTYYISNDWTKLCIDCAPLAKNPAAVAAELEKSGIYAEFTDGRYLVFYLSAGTTKRHLRALFAALEGAVNAAVGSSHCRPPLPAGGESYGYLRALGAPSQYVPLGESVGRICAQNAGVMPPCIPVVVAGEVISRQTADCLQGAPHTFGLKDGKIKVVIDEG